MISVTHHHRGRVLTVVLVSLLTALLLLAMADPSAARLLPRRKWRPNSDVGGGKPPAMVAFACTWSASQVEYRCDDNGGRIRLDAVMEAGGGNGRHNQMAARPHRFTCEPDENASDPPTLTDFTCAFSHGAKPIEFRLDEVTPFTDEEPDPDPCAEVPPPPEDGEALPGTACVSMLPPHDHGVRVRRVVHSPTGDPGDTKNQRLNRERVILHNYWDTAVRIGRARLAHVLADGAAVDRYQLPPGLVLRPGKDLVIHTGKGRNRAGHLYIGESGQVWRRTDHVLLMTRREHDLTQCVYESDAGAGINCNLPVP